MVDSGVGEFIVLLVLGLFLKWKSSPGATDEQKNKYCNSIISNGEVKRKVGE